jgi:hypothetical protein
VQDKGFCWLGGQCLEEEEEEEEEEGELMVGFILIPTCEMRRRRVI